MPLSKHFQGHGAEAMRSMRKAHPDYSEKRVKAEFYATENARKKKDGNPYRALRQKG